VSWEGGEEEERDKEWRKEGREGARVVSKKKTIFTTPTIYFIIYIVVYNNVKFVVVTFHISI
jgi:hypothetical protein